MAGRGSIDYWWHCFTQIYSFIQSIFQYFFTFEFEEAIVIPFIQFFFQTCWILIILPTWIPHAFTRGAKPPCFFVAGSLQHFPAYPCFSKLSSHIRVCGRLVSVPDNAPIGLNQPEAPIAFGPGRHISYPFRMFLSLHQKSKERHSLWITKCALFCLMVLELRRSSLTKSRWFEEHLMRRTFQISRNMRDQRRRLWNGLRISVIGLALHVISESERIWKPTG